eukprot:8938044-Ditylum_brightwellii.AAC.1
MEDIVTLDAMIVLFPILNFTSSVGYPARLLYTPSCHTESIGLSMFPIPPDEPPALTNWIPTHNSCKALRSVELCNSQFDREE